MQKGDCAEGCDWLIYGQWDLSYVHGWVFIG